MLTWWACLAAPAAAAQSAPSLPQSGEGSPDSTPITCWWRTDRTAVHVGERFTLTLTCGITET